MYELLKNKPLIAEIVVLEDEEPVLTRLREAIAKDIKVTCKPAKNMAQYTKIVRSDYKFDAISIDWEMYDVDVGPQAIKLALHVQPDAARIVYTKHQTEEPRAIPLGADASLIKRPGGNIPQYRTVMKKGIRLGMARRILTEVRNLDGDNLPELPPGHLIEERTEKIVYKKSRETACQQKLAFQNGKHLVELLKRRNWWRVFNEEAYIKLPWYKKLAELLGYVDANEKVAASILRTTPDIICRMLEKGCIAGCEATDLYVRAQGLLSVLGYLLRLAGYEPELMSEFWQPPKHEQSQLSSAPWGDKGLGSYLTKHGSLALEQCLNWIRRY